MSCTGELCVCVESSWQLIESRESVGRQGLVGWLVRERECGSVLLCFDWREGRGCAGATPFIYLPFVSAEAGFWGFQPNGINIRVKRNSNWWLATSLNKSHQQRKQDRHRVEIARLFIRCCGTRRGQQFCFYSKEVAVWRTFRMLHTDELVMRTGMCRKLL